MRTPDEVRGTCTGDCEWCSLDCAEAVLPDDLDDDISLDLECEKYFD